MKMKFRVVIICSEEKGFLVPQKKRTFYIEMPMFARTTTYYNIIFSFLNNELGLSFTNTEQIEELKKKDISFEITTGRILVYMKTCIPIPKGYEVIHKKFWERYKEGLLDEYSITHNFRDAVIWTGLIAGAAVIFFPSVLLADWLFKTQMLCLRIEKLEVQYTFKGFFKGFFNIILLEPTTIFFQNLNDNFRWETSIRFSFSHQTNIIMIMTLNTEILKNRNVFENFNLHLEIWKNSLNISGVVICWSTEPSIDIDFLPKNWLTFKKEQTKVEFDEGTYIPFHYVCKKKSCQEPNMSDIDFIDLRLNTDFLNFMNDKPVEKSLSLKDVRKLESKLLKNPTEENKLDYLVNATQFLYVANKTKNKEHIKNFFNLYKIPSRKFCGKIATIYHSDKTKNSNIDPFYIQLKQACEVFKKSQIQKNENKLSEKEIRSITDFESLAIALDIKPLNNHATLSNDDLD